MSRSRSLFLVVLALAAAGCASTAPGPAVPPAPPAAPAATTQPQAPPAPAAPAAAADMAGTIRATLDAKADPCADFYQYACGGWLAATPLPSDQSRWARSFSVINEENQKVLRSLLERAAADPTAGDADWARMGNFFGSCMDETKVEAAGAAPLEQLLRPVAGVADAAAAVRLAGSLLPRGIAPFFDVEVYPDFKDPGVSIAFLSQGGLGLPDRDYYLPKDDDGKALLADYQAHVARMLAMIGETPDRAAAAAGRIAAFETELAKMSRTRVEMRDIEKLYNRLELEGLEKLAPGLPWKAYLAAADAAGVTAINVTTPEFFSGLDRLLAATDVATLRDYLRWTALRSTANLLPKAFVDESFAFYGQRLAGQKEQQPRWKRCVDATGGAMGELVGRFYVQERFPGDSKTTALELIRGIEAAFEANLPTLDWMDAETRQRAAGKLHAVANKIGYPDQWRDYGALATTPGDWFGNAMAARTFEARRQVAKIGHPVDKGEWGMPPAMVNAYYNPLWNEMVFPAGIMQAPFFHRDFPMPVNFGGIGMVMGHELTHGFDDQGRKFDAQGRMVEWWAPEVAQRFEDRAACLVEQYDAYEVQPGVHLNGKLTLGENIADLAGVKLAHQAMRDWVARHPEAAGGLAGFTPDQLFFLGYAQGWCSQESPEIQRMLANVDPHSAPRFRVNGPLSNLPSFAAAFSCGPGTAMRRATACSVW